MPRSAFSFTEGSPRYFSPSPGVKRGLCQNSGAPLTYESERVVVEVHPNAACLLDATVSLSGHVFDVFDDLPRFAATDRGAASPVRMGPRKS